MEPLSVVERDHTIDITIRNSFPDIYSEAFFSMFGWNVSITHMDALSQNNKTILTPSGEDTVPLLDKISSPTEPDNQEGFLNAVFGHEQRPNGYSIYPLGKPDEETVSQPRSSKEKTNIIANLRNYVSSFFPSVSSNYGTVETIKIRIPKQLSKHDKNASIIGLEQLFTVGLPSIYCFTGTSLTFEDVMDIKNDLHEQLKYMENKGYTVSWLNVKRIYRIKGRYVLLSNKDEIKKQNEETTGMTHINNIIERLMDDYISSDEKPTL